MAISIPPSGILGNGARILRRFKPSVTMESILLQRFLSRL
jgi:hypothetical protein